VGKAITPVKQCDTADDAAIVARLKADDTEAFAEILRLHWPAVSRFGVRMLADREAAADAAQEAFVRLWEHRATLEIRSIRAYLLTVVRNLAMDELRKRKVRARFSAVDSRDVAVSADDSIDANALQNDIDRAVKSLPERRREAFVLAFLNDLSYKEVADIMQTSVATVRNHVSTALADLRHALAKYRAGSE
jgi:RNA polymerase sigma-70 factor (ECF subfamily)